MRRSPSAETSSFGTVKIPDRYLRGPGEPIGDHACPACRFLTLAEAPPGTYEIYSICGWEDDPVQFRDPEMIGGANGRSLDEWKSHFEGTVLPEMTTSGFNFPPRA
jgi:cysteine-rich CPCC protein